MHPSLDAVLHADPRMSELVQQYKPFPSQPQGSYRALVRAVIAQQISNKAANTIRERLIRSIGLSAQALHDTPMAQLRSCGVSPRKSLTLKRIAEVELSSGFAELDSSSDEEVRSRLVALPGVGPWTAEMVLLFGLHRPDVWPLNDHGLRAATSRVYGEAAAEALLRFGDRFRPWRSYAAWYLWRTLEND